MFEFILLLIFCLFLILVNFIYQPLSEIELIEGHTAILKYKLSSGRFPVRFLKDNQFIAETTNIKKRVIGRSKTLEFTYVAPSDSGKYCLEVAGKQSSLTELKIHRMLYYFSFWLRNTRSPLCCNLFLHIIFGGLFIVFRYFVSIVLHVSFLDITKVTMDLIFCLMTNVVQWTIVIIFYFIWYVVERCFIGKHTTHSIFCFKFLS